MRDYILIPTYFKLSEISCKVLEDFFRDVKEIKDNKIDLDYLRAFEIKNKHSGRWKQLEKELKLRGFKIIKSDSETLELENESHLELLYIEDNRNRFNLLDRVILGGIEFSEIDSDNYFNNIPIKNFDYILRNFDIVQLKNNFLESGFRIKKAFKTVEINDNEEYKEKKPEKKQRSNEITSKLGRFINSIIINNKEKEEIIRYQKLIDIIPLKNEIDRNIRFLLKKDEIYTIEDLINYDIKRLLKLDGVSEEDISKFEYYIKIKIKDIINSDDINNESYVVNEKNIKNAYKIDLKTFILREIKRNPRKEQDIKDIQLNTILPDRTETEKRIKFKLYNDSIKYIGELLHYDMNRLLKLNGVGVKAIVNFETTIKLAIQEVVNIQEDDDGIDYLKIEMFEKLMEGVLLKDILSNRTSTEKRIITNLDSSGIKTLLDLNYYDISQLMNIKGVGKKAHDDFKKTVHKEYVRLRDQNERILAGERFILNDDYKNKLSNMKLKELINILYSDNLFYKKISNKKLNMELREFYNIKYNSLKDITLVSLLMNLEVDVKNSLDINKLLNKIKPKQISKRDENIVFNRMLSNKTLELVGKENNLTRERVRQIEINYINKINKNAKKENFIKYLKLYFYNNDNFLYEDLLEVLDSDNQIFSGIIKKNNIENLVYIPEIGRVDFIESENEKKFKEDFDEEIDKFYNRIPIFGKQKRLDAKISYNYKAKLGVSIDDIYNMLEKRGCTFKGEYYFKDNLSKRDALEVYFKYIVGEVEINKNSVMKMKKDIEELFDSKITLDSNIRNISSVIDRIDDVILIRPRTYKHISKIDVDKNDIKYIKKIIDKKLNESKIGAVYSSVILEEFIKKRPGSNINTKHKLYYFMKYYYSNEYLFGKKNTLQIALKGKVIKSNSEIIYDILKKYASTSIVSINNIQKKTNWDKHSIDMAVANSDGKVIKIGSNKYAILEDLFIKDELNQFKEILREELLIGFTTSEKLMFRTLTMEDFINRNRISNSKEICSIAKAVDGNVEGHTVFLYRKDQSVKSVEDIVEKKHPEKFFRNDIFETFRDLGISESNISTLVNDTIKNLLNTKRYVQVEREKYLKYDLFKIEPVIKQFILEYSNKKYSEDKYFIPENHIIDFKKEFRIYDLNQFMIASILYDHGYRKLHRVSMRYDLEILVLVKNNSKYRDISELTKDLLINKYQGENNELEIYDFLSELGIYEVTQNKEQKNIKEDLLKGKANIQVDKYGRVKYDS